MCHATASAAGFGPSAGIAPFSLRVLAFRRQRLGASSRPPSAVMPSLPPLLPLVNCRGAREPEPPWILPAGTSCRPRSPVTLRTKSSRPSGYRLPWTPTTDLSRHHINHRPDCEIFYRVMYYLREEARHLINMFGDVFSDIGTPWMPTSVMSASRDKNQNTRLNTPTSVDYYSVLRRALSLSLSFRT